MLSRVAERVYWLGRHLERVENTARLILVRHNAVLDLPREVQPGWDLLLQVLGAEQGFAALHGAPSEKNIIGFVFGERENPSSIISSLSGARGVPCTDCRPSALPCPPTLKPRWLKNATGTCASITCCSHARHRFGFGAVSRPIQATTPAYRSGVTSAGSCAPSWAYSMS